MCGVKCGGDACAFLSTFSLHPLFPSPLTHRERGGDRACDRYGGGVGKLEHVWCVCGGRRGDGEMAGPSAPQRDERER